MSGLFEIGKNFGSVGIYEDFGCVNEENDDERVHDQRANDIACDMPR